LFSGHAYTATALRALLVFSFLSFSFSVHADELDLFAYNVDPAGDINIPQSCRTQFTGSALSVGVVDFNNHAYGKVKVPESWAWWKDAEVKLPEVASETLISELVGIGGAQIYTRGELKKVIEEQKLQMSGLVDDNSLVGLGKLAGIRYIATGSISNLGFTSSAVSLMLGATPQMEIQLSIRMIDVSTGEIVVSKDISGKYLLDSNDYVGVINAIKKAMNNAFEDIRPEFSKQFTVRRFILETRSAPAGRIALVDMGAKAGLKKDDKLFVYQCRENKNPLTSVVTCGRMKLPVEGVVSGQVDEQQAWIYLKGDKDKVGRVCVGNIVERAPMEGQNLFKKWGLW